MAKASSVASALAPTDQRDGGEKLPLTPIARMNFGSGTAARTSDGHHAYRSWLPTADFAVTWHMVNLASRKLRRLFMRLREPDVKLRLQI